MADDDYYRDLADAGMDVFDKLKRGEYDEINCNREEAMSRFRDNAELLEAVLRMAFAENLHDRDNAAAELLRLSRDDVMEMCRIHARNHEGDWQRWRCEERMREKEERARERQEAA